MQRLKPLDHLDRLDRLDQLIECPVHVSNRVDQVITLLTCGLTDNANKVTGSLGEGQISRIYKRLARQSGISENIVKQISGHSLRVGGAQEMLRHGSSLPQIMVKGGWSKTDTVMRYVEKALVHSSHLEL